MITLLIILGSFTPMSPAIAFLIWAEICAELLFCVMRIVRGW